jgi:hypothetical protein
MHLGLNVDITRIHHMLPQLPQVAAELFVLEGNLLTQQEIPTHVDTHELAAVLT